MPAEVQLYMFKFPLRITTSILEGFTELLYGYRNEKKERTPGTKDLWYNP